MTERKMGIQFNLFELAHIRLAQKNKRNIDDIEITEELMDMAIEIRKRLSKMIEGQKRIAHRYLTP